jgi:hypothetical protein
MANEFKLKRPATYTFSSVQDLLKDVDQWRGKEGVCVYSGKPSTQRVLFALAY